MSAKSAESDTSSLPAIVFTPDPSVKLILGDNSSTVLIESKRPSSSAIAVDTVDAVVPMAPAEIVPSSASCSLIALVISVAVVVSVDTSPTESTS